MEFNSLSNKRFNEVDKAHGEEEFVEIVQSKQIKQLIKSPFIAEAKSWDDEELQIPDVIRSNIINKLGFQKPSKI